MTTVHPLCLLLAPFFRACGGIGWNLWCDVTKGPLISEQHHLPDFSTALSFSFFVLCCECTRNRAVLWWFVDIFVCNQSCKAAPLESGMKNRSKEVRTRDLYAALRPKKKSFISCNEETLENVYPHLPGGKTLFVPLYIHSLLFCFKKSNNLCIPLFILLLNIFKHMYIYVHIAQEFPTYAPLQFMWKIASLWIDKCATSTHFFSCNPLGGGTVGWGFVGGSDSALFISKMSQKKKKRRI